MIHYLQAFRSYVAIILFAALVGAPTNAQADDINPQIANCEEMQDADTLTQMRNCSTHVGCNMILKLQNTCAKAKGFLDRLKASLSGRTDVTNNDVFEANMPTLTQSDALIRQVSAVRKIVHDSMNDPSWGKLTINLSNGSVNYYEGGLKDGSFHGVGVVINSGGIMGRGPRLKNRLFGLNQVVTTRAIIAGNYVDSEPQGNIAYQNQNGTVFAGVYLGGDKWSGVVEVTKRNGDHYKKLNSAEGEYIADGPVAKAGQVAEAPSLPEPSATERIAKQYDERISAARSRCATSEGNCQSGCATAGVVGIFAILATKGEAGGDTSGKIQQCSDSCDNEKKRCDQQVASLEREKSQAIAEIKHKEQQSAAAAQQMAGENSTGASNSNSSATNSNWQSARTCDGQCALLIAETKCKHIRDSRENLSCLMQNGAGGDNTPEICAQAKSLTGCMTKAEKLAAKNSSETTAPKKYRYGSVCERNYEKIQDVIRKNNIMQAGATYDLFMKDVQWHFAKIFEPCTGSSTEAARAYKASMDEYNKISQYCAGAHPKYTCTQWGASGGISDNGGNPYNNPAYYAVFKAEVDKALSDPNYSADLGTVTGSGAVNVADAACAASLKTIENQYSAAQRGIPANSVVVLSEANMWRIAKSIEAIKTQCPQSERYKAEVASIQSSYAEVKRVCDATASSPPCKPRLPGKEPAPAPQVATALPPLQAKPPASCESQSGANWKRCLQEACAKLNGEFSGNSCVSCYWGGGGWNRCPPGSGGVNSNQ